MNRHVNTIHPEEKFDNIVEVIKPSFAETHDSFQTNIESKGNRNFVIIENKLIQKPTINVSEQNSTETETDVPKNINNESGNFGYQIKNQINVIMEVPSSVSNLLSLKDKAEDHPTRLDSKAKESPEDWFILKNESNSKRKDFKSEDQNQTEIILTPENEMQNSNTTNLQSQFNLENHAPFKSQDDILAQNDFELKTQTISSVIRSVGNVKKNLCSYNVTANTKAIDKTNSEYIHKKYCRNNYNIDLYRKILGCDDEDDEDQQQENNDCTPPNHSCNNIENNILKSAGPVHWRKSFKNNYETSAYCDG